MAGGLTRGAPPSHGFSYTAPARALNHCIELVKRHQREMFVCHLHAPPEAQPHLFVLSALNVETARVRSAVVDGNAGRMRMAWWRSTVDAALRGVPSEHPVAQGLAHTHARVGLTARYLTQLLDAREADLAVTQPRDRVELLQYCERTAGALLLLGLECCGVAGSDAAERAASLSGTALGLTTVLRGAAAHAAEGSTYLPAEVTTRHGVNLSRLLRREPSAELADAVAEVADDAVAHLLAARSLQPEIPCGAARRALLPAGLADHTLQQLQQSGYDPFAEAVLAPAGARLQLTLAWRRLLGRF